MSLTPEQLEMRRTGIGGSEIAAIVGEHPFLSSFDLYAIKTGAYTVPENEDMKRGTFLEPAVLRWYCDKTGAVVSPILNGTIRHATISRVLATPDAVVGLQIYPEYRLVEIKCPRGADGWGPDGSDEIPPGYLLQVQWTHAVLASIGPIDPEIHVAALIWGDLRIYRIKSDTELQDYLFQAAQAWWVKHIDGKTPPELDGGPGANAWLKSRLKQSRPLREATARDEILLAGLRATEADLERAEKENAVAKQLVCEAIGEAEGISATFGRVTWRADKNGNRVLRTKWSEENK